VVGAALRRPPHNLVLSHGFPASGLRPLAEDSAREFGALPGILAGPEQSLEFARVWTDLTGRRHSPQSAAARPGRKLCFLFTNLANPTSNKIYKRIGYRRVCDVDEYRFT
jgi:hypothetical protein